MKKYALLLFSFHLLYSTSLAQSFIHKDSLFAQSIKENKPVLLVFSGSDWCANCIRFDKQILQDSTFKKFLEENLFYLNADFPQRKKQTAALKQQNEALAEQYNPDGIFPSIFLRLSKENVVPLSFQKETAAQFIEKIKSILLTSKEKHGAQN